LISVAAREVANVHIAFENERCESSQDAPTTTAGQAAPSTTAGSRFCQRLYCKEAGRSRRVGFLRALKSNDLYFIVETVEAGLGDVLATAFDSPENKSLFMR